MDHDLMAAATAGSDLETVLAGELQSMAESAALVQVAASSDVSAAAAQQQQLQMTAEGLITEPVLSVRMLMSSRDVGSIIGKGGVTIKTFREQSGARINISNSTSSERLVTVTGNRESICRAFEAIGRKIEQDLAVSKAAAAIDSSTGSEPLPSSTSSSQHTLSSSPSSSQHHHHHSSSSPNLSFRLVIQTSQCGSLIGKGGAKIKDIREKTGASIQVAGETLPNSTERAVTVSGSPDAIMLCISQVCNIMLENPPRGPFIPYKPHALPNQAYQPRVNPNLPYQAPYTATFHTAAGPTTTTQQMRIPNDLIGCVIGRKGSKIHEIRVSSGAQIKIAGNEGESTDRLVTITGTPEAVGMAQYLINSRIHSEVNTFISVGMSL